MSINWRAQRGKFFEYIIDLSCFFFRNSIIILNKLARAARKIFNYIIDFSRFSQRTLCVDKIISQPRGILCVDKIGSADRGILCVDKIGSPEIPQDPCSRLRCWGLICWGLICLRLICSRLIRRDCLRRGSEGGAGTATGPHSHVVHISHTPTERAHTDPKIISFGKKQRSEKKV